MRIIPLTQSKFTLVDDEDYDWLIESSWSYARGSGNTGYADGNPEPMHRCILRKHNLWVERLCPDHSNGWGLDNRKANLRMVTQAENNANRSGSRGIWKRRSGALRAVISQEWLGSFPTQSEAELARVKAEQDRGWLTLFERRDREEQLLCDLQMLVDAGVIQAVDGGPRLEDRFVCTAKSLFQQRAINNKISREVDRRAQEFGRHLERVQREAAQYQYKLDEPKHRREAMQKLQAKNRQLYFHSTLGWRARLPSGEVSVPDRATGLALLGLPDASLSAATQPVIET